MTSLGVEAVSIHGGKDQAERNEAIKLYKEGKKDVLVATDIAAKGMFAYSLHTIYILVSYCLHNACILLAY